jgi:hypothetical protein
MKEGSTVPPLDSPALTLNGNIISPRPPGLPAGDVAGGSSDTLQPHHRYVRPWRCSRAAGPSQSGILSWLSVCRVVIRLPLCQQEVTNAQLDDQTTNTTSALEFFLMATSRGPEVSALGPPISDPKAGPQPSTSPLSG